MTKVCLSLVLGCLTVTSFFPGSKGQTNGSLRLVGGGSYYGRLEVFLNGQWGTVCDDGFSRSDANVACRQLGFNRGYCWGAVGAFGYPEGDSSSPIWLDDLQCSSGDESLIDCDHSTPTGRHCRHSEDVGLVCRSGQSCNGFTRTCSSCGGGSSYIYYSSGGLGTIIFLCILFIYMTFRCHRRGNHTRTRVNTTTTTRAQNNRRSSQNNRPSQNGSNTRRSSHLAANRTNSLVADSNLEEPAKTWDSQAPPSYSAVLHSPQAYKTPLEAANQNAPPGHVTEEAPPPYPATEAEIAIYPPAN